MESDIIHFMTCNTIISAFDSFLNGAEFFAKEVEANPARIHSPDPFLRAGKFSRSFGKSFPKKIVLPKLCPHCSAICPNTWRAEPRKKNTLSFSKRNFTPAKSEMQGVFFLSGLLAYSPVRGASVHSFSFRSKKVRAKCIITAHNKKPRHIKAGFFVVCLYCTKLALIFKTKANRTRGARGDSKLNRTLR